MRDLIPNYVLVVDALRVKDATAFATTHEKPWFFLYDNTPWKAQRQNSPVCITVTKDDALWSLWQNNSLWASSAVLFEFDSAIPQENRIDTLQKLITVNSQDGRLFLLRFYSPNTLSFLMAHLSNDEKQIFFGTADAVLTSFNVAESQPIKRYEPPTIKTVLADKDLVLDNQLVEAMFQ
ncbi:hypothetical protein A1OW_04040 [Enterovibrio norvegicus]|uniref:DUF4123 domain-containing protein n=2 Tax=Enterovibrio norvegicus TaxID=188144 RepID=A0A1I5SLL1_9GAMM|nr:DUF4123 domain-containing protein [Enterovibrio norvegicus]OEF56205.1 hypothetical protein A1OU_15655 [Enterovibrio norvegicus]OEF60125.1 hypothetical protein A1OW_04040 [Enterovibrio norvegicus]SFP71599.1 protein of unknown function [Enterovibrio norvegicus DSM 15893]